MNSRTKLYVVAHGKGRQRFISIADGLGNTFFQSPPLASVMAQKAIDGKLDMSLPLMKLAELAWQEQYDNANRLVQCWNAYLDCPVPTPRIQFAETVTTQSTKPLLPRLY